MNENNNEKNIESPTFRYSKKMRNQSDSILAESAIEKNKTQKHSRKKTKEKTENSEIEKSHKIKREKKDISDSIVLGDENDVLEARKKTGKRIVINEEKLETRVALLSGKRLDEYQIERGSDRSISGSIFIGRITNLESSLEAAFVDIGQEKNAFLHYRDMLPVTYDISERISHEEENLEGKKPKKTFASRLAEKIRTFIGKRSEKNVFAEQEAKKRKSTKITDKDVPSLFPIGSEVLVQVSKGPIGTKGARVTTNISIPGRYLVLLPYADHIGISKKIEDRAERNRLRDILNSFDLPPGLGLICRTVGEGRKKEHFMNDLNMLLDVWHQMELSLNKPKIPMRLFEEPNLLDRTLRDFLTEDIDEIIVDTDSAYQFFKQRFEQVIGSSQNLHLKLYNRSEPIFEYTGVSKQIDQIFARQVPLPSGGSLVIDETEALVAIDVNTGKMKSGKDQPDNILTTNSEAAIEIARQLRLRNVGGLVVIDFIDMFSQKHRDKIFQLMNKLAKEDRARTDIYPISRLGLMEMTRQREHESLLNTVYDPCPYCSGRGKVRSAFSISIEVHRRLQELMKRNNLDSSFRVLLHPVVLMRMKNEDADIIKGFEQKFGSDLSFRPDASLHLEEFKVVNPVTGVEYK